MRALLPARWTPLFLMAGCAFGPDKSSIADQLSPSGSCWDVDLSDGIDDASTDELHDLFDCLNRTGNLSAFEPLDAAMDSENRQGDKIGLSLIRLSNAIASDDLDMLGLAGSAISFLEGSRSETELLLRSAVELAYGVPYSDIGENFDVYAEGGLEAG